MAHFPVLPDFKELERSVEAIYEKTRPVSECVAHVEEEKDLYAVSVCTPAT